MKTFILFTMLPPEIYKQLKDSAAILQNWLDEVKTRFPEVKFIFHYALLGSYDFAGIYAAPDEETAAIVSMISLTNGTFQAESLAAIPYKGFLNR